MFKSLKYIAICSLDTSPGVYKKVLGFVNGATSLGMNSSYEFISPSGFSGYLNFIKSIYRSKEEVIVIRYLPIIGLVFFFLGILLRLRGQKLVVDVPTPLITLIKEIRLHNRKKLSKFLHQLIIYVQGPLPFLTAFKVIQYSIESGYFTLGSNNRTQLIGNGIEVESIGCRRNSPLWPAPQLNLIAVGTVACWHGWDRLIEVLFEIKRDSLCDFRIKFTVVGTGPDLKRLRQLVSDLNMTDEVDFRGHLVGEDLENEYAKAHLAVGSLGWDRVGITLASPLKSREYLAAGLPFVYLTEDIDLKEGNKVSFYMETIEELKGFLIEIKNQNLPSFTECRGFAEAELVYSKKVARILGV